MNYWAIPPFPVSVSHLRGTVAFCQARRSTHRASSAAPEETTKISAGRRDASDGREAASPRRKEGMTLHPQLLFTCNSGKSRNSIPETPQNRCTREAGVNNNQRLHMDDGSALSGQDETRRSSSGCLGRGGNAGQGEESQPGTITEKLITGTD